MPPKQCGRCNKTVYPTEELKCLDKVWHKGCFKCQVCNMTLNMKNYKGYDKLPYCNTHYPQTKFTAVADTPELRRIQENTKVQSNIKYHAEFEKQKGKKIQIADDPEMQRVRQNMSVISNVTYHGEMEKRQQMERQRPAEQVEGEAPQMRNRQSDYEPQASQVRASNPPPQGPGRIADYDPQEGFGQQGGTPYSNRNSAGARQVYDSNVGRVDQPPTRKVGSISDYDPMNENYGSITGQYKGPHPGQPQQQAPPPQQQAYQPPPPQQQAPPPAASRGMVCRALYDYSAADTDEVSFEEGDLIINCQPIDAGWMEGEVEKTRKRGMLPSNYVEKVA